MPKQNLINIFIFSADLEYLIESINGCKNNPKNLFEIKVGEHIPSAFSMSAISSFKSMENKHDLYRHEDCMKQFCESIREHAIKAIRFKKKKSEVINKIPAGIL